MILELVRPEIRAMSAYHVADVSEDCIKLDAMEVPYSLPENLRQALAKKLVDAPINRYPNPTRSGLQETLRSTFAIPDKAQIALGNGSDELIQLLTMLVAKPDAVMLSLEPSFVMYRHNAALFGMKHIGVPLNPDLTLNRQAVLDAIIEHQPALIFLAYPNNPTGVPFNREDVEAIIQAATGIIVIDEAYGAFSDDSFLSQAGQPENLVVLRTLSKIGFAGLRIGYAAGDPSLMNELAKITPPYNMNTLSLTAATFALQHMDAVNAHIDILKAERERMASELAMLPESQVFVSQANFITVRLPDAPTAFEALKAEKIWVKQLSGSHTLLENCLRLTIGTPEENNRVLVVLRAYAEQVQSAKKLIASAKSDNLAIWWILTALVVIATVVLFIVFA
ncbi:MAG: histidinol-phosphate transaminase [Alysiella sp.]|uniref:histidinol-phosphate transaminase n=1 Tax=Alysiella sp. TaxID=1872483 RepID=UPI0026DD847B|nr:histidinol-phosphate transaminase [Alysiella sp.]MDO4433346.1 histidinol-phosphate transaminase [Alysiella sp.]